MCLLVILCVACISLFDTRCRPQHMEHKNSEMSNCWLLVAVALLCVERVKSEYLFKAPIYLRGGVGKMGTDRVFSPAEAQGGKLIDPQSTAVVLIEFQVCHTTTQRHARTQRHTHTRTHMHRGTHMHRTLNILNVQTLHITQNITHRTSFARMVASCTMQSRE